MFRGLVMADGDIFRKLGRIYQKSYKWLCEGKASSTECARTVIKALKQDLKIKGNLPIILAQQMGEKLKQIFGDITGLNCINWGVVNKEIEKIVQVDGRHDLKELILRAGKKFIQDVRYGEAVDINSASEAIVKNYIYEVYESRFKECMPLTDKHYTGIDNVTLEGRINKMQPDVMTGINALAKKASIDGSVEKLRLPNRRQVTKIDMDEDLC